MSLTHPSICPTCGKRRQRSVNQNARYWALLNELSKSQGYTSEVWHEYFKRQYLPMREVELPDWSVMLVPVSTSNLPMFADPNEPDAPNWETYTIKVERFAAELGVYLQEAA